MDRQNNSNHYFDRVQRTRVAAAEEVAPVAAQLAAKVHKEAEEYFRTKGKSPPKDTPIPLASGVRIWLWRSNERAGHAALQTSKHYFSFYPNGEAPDAKPSGIPDSVPADVRSMLDSMLPCFRTQREDLLVNGVVTPATYVVDLQLLDQRIELISQRIKHWEDLAKPELDLLRYGVSTALAELDDVLNFDPRSGSGAKLVLNCSTSVFHLLREGGACDEVAFWSLGLQADHFLSYETNQMAEHETIRAVFTLPQWMRRSISVRFNHCTPRNLFYLVSVWMFLFPYRPDISFGKECRKAQTALAKEFAERNLESPRLVPRSLFATLAGCFSEFRCCRPRRR